MNKRTYMALVVLQVLLFLACIVCFSINAVSYGWGRASTWICLNNVIITGSCLMVTAIEGLIGG